MSPKGILFNSYLIIIQLFKVTSSEYVHALTGFTTVVSGGFGSFRNDRRATTRAVHVGNLISVHKYKGNSADYFQNFE